MLTIHLPDWAWYVAIIACIAVAVVRVGWNHGRDSLAKEREQQRRDTR